MTFTLFLKPNYTLVLSASRGDTHENFPVLERAATALFYPDIHMSARSSEPEDNTTSTRKFKGEDREDLQDGNNALLAKLTLRS